MKATKAELRQEIAKLRHIGRQMSNVMFNLAQQVIPDYPADKRAVHQREIFKGLYKQWDEIKRAERT